MNASRSKGYKKPCKVSPNKRTVHHRRPICADGTREKPNISYFRHVDHVAFHRLFGPGLPHGIAETINAIWIDPDFELVVRKREVPLTENGRFRTGHPKRKTRKKRR